MQSETVEIAQIRLRPGVTEEDFLAAFQRIVDGFVRQQPGFLKCELLKKDNGQFLDLVHWAARSDAVNALERSSKNDACLAYFRLLEADETDSNSGVEYLANVTPKPAKRPVSWR
ncbi:MAG: antibiotic biosynthesis monooxygenase [Paracoccaceae bacterium]|nr:antibiotic biosynthesis monooxygenase [Paracoccaceae bacterium]